MIVPIRDGAAMAEQSIGPKARLLCALWEKGYEICDGAVLTAETFRTFCRENDSDPDTIEGQKVEALPFPGGLQEELNGWFHRLSSHAGAVIVRSCAMEEDREGKTRAGAFLSVPDCRSSGQMLDGIKKVWCSLIQGGAARSGMAVLIQQQLLCRVSGVAFSCDPSEKNNRPVLEAVRGQNYGVTDGTACVQRFSGTVCTHGPRGILSHREAKELCRLVKKLEEDLGFACDVEWGMDTKRIVLFQVRPFRLPCAENPFGPPVTQQDCILLDRYAQAASPCYLSLLEEWQEKVYLSFYSRKPGKRFSQKPLCFLYHRVYWNVHYQRRYFEDTGKRGPALLRWSKQLWLLFLSHFSYRGFYNRVPFYEKKIRLYRDQLEQTRTAREAARLMEQIIHTFTWTMGRDHYRFLGLAQVLYRRLEEKLSGTMRQDAARWIAQSKRENKTLTVNRELLQLALLVRETPALRALFLQATGKKELAKAVLETGQFPAFSQAFRLFLQRHGHRGTGCDDLARPRWAQAPEQVLTLIGQLAAQDRLFRQEKADPPSPPVPKNLKSLVRLTGEYMTLRENQRYYFDYSWALLRSLLLKIGEQMTALGTLSGAEEIFLLRIQEIRQAVRWPGLHWNDITAKRQEQMAADAAMTPPYMLRDSQTVAVQKKRGKQFKAMGISAGSAQGPVRILLGPEDFDAVRQGDIGVVRTFHPSWTPILRLVSGLVMCYGNVLSHGAVVAREYGIPVVVFNDDATKILHNGDQIEVDGTSGRIHLLQAKEEKA